MAITRETVEYVANLSRIELKAEELDKLSGQLKGILDFIDKLSKIDIEKIEPTSHILALKNILRQDSPGESLPVNRTLENAPRKQDNFFVVPKVIE